VHPGVVVEERFSHVHCEDCPPDEFTLFTIWGRVWLAKHNIVAEDRYYGGWIHRNGSMAYDSPADEYPDYVDFSRLVKLAETLGANKDMFRTDVFVGVPSSADVKKGATLEERRAAVKYAVSECEIFPTTPFDYFYDTTTPMQDEGARLWVAGYKMGNYRTVPNTEVPTEFIERGGRLSEHDDFEPFAQCEEQVDEEDEEDQCEVEDDEEEEEDQCDAVDDEDEGEEQCEAENDDEEEKEDECKAEDDDERADQKLQCSII